MISGMPPAMTIHGASRMRCIAFLQDAPPARRRRRNAHAEIGQARLERHDRGDVHAGDDEQRSHDIGQDVHAMMRRGGRPSRADRLDMNSEFLIDSVAVRVRRA